ncbi:hypothetical protein F3J28_03245 [Enterobacter sp. Ap-1006]|uniref:hypothetical protein n=1 Tax=Enterobacter sp. Ap-1006 TaxID=2608345 RepID=UPI0014216D93|nr:hypothetical protein [Enterobacter sp. Ap-1006]NIF46785.1 hypothetical protein [Enterobacter sp. Ap-1006]
MMQMQMFKYPHGEGERCCRIDNDGPVACVKPIAVPRQLRLTPRLSRFARTNNVSQTCIRVGGHRHGD